MYTISLGNVKGGVGKTSLTFNLGHGLAGRGRRVLWIDADYQADLTAMAGAPESPGVNMLQVMTGALTMRQIVREIRPLLHLAPSDIELANVDAALSARIGRENVLRRALQVVGDDYDVCIIDCGPSLGLMTVNSLAASNAVMIPLQPTATDWRALQTYLTTIEDIRQINPALQVLGVVLTFFVSRYGLHSDVVNAVEAAGIPIMARVGRSVRIPEATGAHLPLSEYDASNPQVTAFQELTEVINQWLNINHAQH